MIDIVGFDFAHQSLISGHNIIVAVTILKIKKYEIQ